MVSESVTPSSASKGMGLLPRLELVTYTKCSIPNCIKSGKHPSALLAHPNLCDNLHYTTEKVFWEITNTAKEELQFKAYFYQ